MTPNYDVAVVGHGPTGLTAAPPRRRASGRTANTPSTTTPPYATCTAVTGWHHRRGSRRGV